MSDVDPGGVLWPRRTVLAAALAAVVAPVTGCGLRLDDNAPMLPDPARLPGLGPHPSEQLLRRELTSCEAAMTAALAVRGRDDPALAAPLARVHATQVAALRARLQDIGADVAAATPSASGGSSSPRPTPTPATPAQLQALLRAEAHGTRPTDLEELAAADEADLPLLGGCRAVRAAAASLLGGPAVVTSLPPRVASPAQAQSVLYPADALVYGLQVAVVRAGPARREVATASSTWATTLRDALQVPAGPSASPAPMGYTLPFPVPGPAAADRLAQHVLGRFADAVLTVVPGAAGHAGAASSLVTLIGAAEVHRVRWGGDIRAVGAPTS